MKVKSHQNVNKLPDSESCHPNLSPDTTYMVIGIEHECYRIVNDSLEPVLYPKDIFDVIDPNYPESWVRTEFDDGEYYVEPPEFSGVGFFEDYFDGVDSAISIYRHYLELNGITS